jgi:hypothetical protein
MPFFPLVQLRSHLDWSRIEPGLVTVCGRGRWLYTWAISRAIGIAAPGFRIHNAVLGQVRAVWWHGRHFGDNCVLYKYSYAASGSAGMVSSELKISAWWTGKDAEGMDRGIIWVTAAEYSGGAEEGHGVPVVPCSCEGQRDNWAEKKPESSLVESIWYTRTETELLSTRLMHFRRHAACACIKETYLSVYRLCEVEAISWGVSAAIFQRLYVIFLCKCLILWRHKL